MPSHRPRLAAAVTAATGTLLALVMVGAPAHSRSLDPVSAGQDAPTAARATRTVEVAYTAGVSTMQRLLDRCDGPVAIRIEGIRPRLLAEHDFCGGRWVLGLDRGDIVRIQGGNIGGQYRAGDSKVVRKGSSATVLRGMGDVVAQTCRPDGDTLRLVGLTRID